MKRKILSILLAVCMLIPGLTALNACGGGVTGGDSGDYLSFTLLEDGTYSVSLKDNYRVWRDENHMPHGGDDKFDLVNKDIRIPDTYEGKAVTQIAASGFQDSYMKSIEIPASVRFIGRYAFMGAMNLEKVELPEGVQVICPQAFDYGEVLQYVVVPASVQYIGDFAFGSHTNPVVKIFYQGTVEQFANVKGLYYSAKDGQTDELVYCSTPFDICDKFAVYVKADDITNLADYITDNHRVGGVWKYNAQQEIECAAIEYANTVGGKTFLYSHSEVIVTDEFWQMLLSAQAQGMLESVLGADEIQMFNASSNKEEYAQKCVAYHAAAMAGMSVIFENGQMTTWYNGVQYSQPFDYAELGNGSIYYKVRNVYTLAFQVVGNEIVEEHTTEYSGVKHYYSLQA